LFDEAGNIGAGSNKFLQNWMDQYVLWVKKHAGFGNLEQIKRIE
jgi:chromate reductase, NAD(P)H dehydrogenase (quinone)